MNSPGSEVILYQTEDNRTRLQVRLEGETVWLTQAQMAELFQTTVPNINLHLGNIFEEGELAEGATVKEYLIVRPEGQRQVSRAVLHYNLEAILAVGYRVRSPRGTQFRQWATARLKEYLVKGFTMDDERLKNPPGPGHKDYFDELLERIRDIRSEASQKFFATVQNKMHWATHGHTAAELIHERADSGKPFMGLRTTRPGGRVRKEDAAIAKNYLTEDELKVLNRIVTLYLDFAELQAMERNLMKMSDWITKLDEFLKVFGRKLLDHAGKVSHEQALAKAEREFAKFRALEDAKPRPVDDAFVAAVKKVKQLKPAKKPKKS